MSEHLHNNFLLFTNSLPRLAGPSLVCCFFFRIQHDTGDYYYEQTTIACVFTHYRRCREGTTGVTCEMCVNKTQTSMHYRLRHPSITIIITQTADCKQWMQKCAPTTLCSNKTETIEGPFWTELNWLGWIWIPLARHSRDALSGRLLSRESRWGLWERD